MGKRLYSRYFVNDKNPLHQFENQVDLESKIALGVNNLNVAKNNESKKFFIVILNKSIELLLKILIVYY